MQISDKGQVTIPSKIRMAVGLAPGSEVAFTVEGGRIVITPVATSLRDDRRAAMRKAAARVQASMSPEFRQLGADDIMAFLRGDSPAATARSKAPKTAATRTQSADASAPRPQPSAARKGRVKADPPRPPSGTGRRRG